MMTHRQLGKTAPTPNAHAIMCMRVDSDSWVPKAAVQALSKGALTPHTSAIVGLRSHRVSDVRCAAVQAIDKFEPVAHTPTKIGPGTLTNSNLGYMWFSAAVALRRSDCNTAILAHTIEVIRRVLIVCNSV